MARRRTPLNHQADAGLRACIARGLSAQETARYLATRGVRMSTRTVGRRMRELRGAVQTERVARRPSVRPVAAPPVSAEPSARSLCARVLREWCEAQPDPAAALEAVLADLAVIHASRID